MSHFQSTIGREALVRIIRQINPAETPRYGAKLDDWLQFAGCAPGLASLRVLVDILKRVNPAVADLYGPMLESWASRPANCYALAAILKMVNPPLAPAYGPLLDAWARHSAPRQDSDAA